LITVMWLSINTNEHHSERTVFACMSVGAKVFTISCILSALDFYHIGL